MILEYNYLKILFHLISFKLIKNPVFHVNTSRLLMSTIHSFSLMQFVRENSYTLT